MSLIMSNIAGKTVGCGRTIEWHNECGHLQQWVCTDHVRIDGVVHHVAGASNDICAIWTDDGRETVWKPVSGRRDHFPRSWKSAYTRFANENQVSDEDVAATAIKVQQLLESLQHGN